LTPFLFDLERLVASEHVDINPLRVSATTQKREKRKKKKKK